MAGDKELTRQFRLLNQMLTMHSLLRDRYTKYAVILDLVLLTCAVIFCATTFARSDLFAFVGLSPQRTQYVLGAASIAAFLSSLAGLRLDWKGRSALHRDAVQKLTQALATFRKHRNPDGTWPREGETELTNTYWVSLTNIVEIPEGLFVYLKARHLRKVELSRMLDSFPGIPLTFLRIRLFLKSLKKMVE